MLPESVTIMGVNITVKRPRELESEGASILGSYDIDTHTIEVVAHLEHKEALSTLIHEMTHAWLRLSSLTDLLELTENTEEGVVLSFERHFLPAIASALCSDMLTCATKSKKAAKQKAKRDKK